MGRERSPICVRPGAPAATSVHGPVGRGGVGGRRRPPGLGEGGAARLGMRLERAQPGPRRRRDARTRMAGVPRVP